MRCFYLRNEQKFPVACVVSEKKGDFVEFGVATWNPLDKFSKQQGRLVAEGRVQEALKATVNRPRFTGVVSGLATGQIKTLILAEIIKAMEIERDWMGVGYEDGELVPAYPEKTRAAAKLMLKQRLAFKPKKAPKVVVARRKKTTTVRRKRKAA